MSKGGSIKVGVLGFGAIGKQHARVLKDILGEGFIGIFDPEKDNDIRKAGFNSFSRIEDLLNVGLSYCVISAPTALHEDLALIVAASGTGALIEKPISYSGESAERISTVFAESSLLGAVGHIERFNPALIALKKKIESGLLGDIYQISTSRQGPFPSRVGDVGVVLDLATHDIHSTMWVSNSNYLRIVAETSHKANRPHEDLLVASGRLESGIVVSHVVNWLSPYKERKFVVTGEHGTLIADTLTADLTFFENGVVSGSWESLQAFRGVAEGNIIRFALEKVEPLRLEHLEMIKAIETNNFSNLVSLKDATKVVEVAESILQGH